MVFRSRRLVQNQHLNPFGVLFGGQMLAWIDEEAAIYAMCQLESSFLVTKAMSNINFLAPVNNGDIIEFGCETQKIGNTSITISCLVRNKTTKKDVIKVDSITFVNMNPDGSGPMPHNKENTNLLGFQ